MFGRNKSDQENNYPSAGDKTNGLYRGPGLYNQDMQTIENRLRELKDLLATKNKSGEDEAVRLIKLVIDGVVTLNEGMTEKFAALEEAIGLQTQNMPKQLNRLDKLPNKEDLKNLENKTLERFKAFETMLSNATTEIRQIVQPGGGAPRNNNFPGGGSNNNQTHAHQKPFFKETDIKNHLDKLRKPLEKEFQVSERIYELKTTKKRSTFWEIKPEESAEDTGNETASDAENESDVPRKRFLTGFFAVTGNHKQDKEVLIEMRNSLTKYINPAETDIYDPSAVTIIFTFGLMDPLKLEMGEWVQTGVGLFPIDSFMFIFEMWKQFDEDIKQFFAYKTIIKTEHETAQVSAAAESGASGQKINPNDESKDATESQEIGEKGDKSSAPKQPVAEDRIPVEVASQTIGTEMEKTEPVLKGDSEISEEEVIEESEDNYRYEAGD